MYVLFLLGIIAYTITGLIKNILAIKDYFDRKTQEHNEEVKEDIKKKLVE